MHHLSATFSSECGSCHRFNLRKSTVFVTVLENGECRILGAGLVDVVGMRFRV